MSVEEAKEQLKKTQTSGDVFWSTLSQDSEEESNFVCTQQSEIDSYKALAFELDQLGQSDQNLESLKQLKAGQPVDSSHVKVVSSV